MHGSDPFATENDTTPTVCAFGPFVLDRRQQRLWRGAEEIRLPPRAFALLLMLTSDPGAVFSRSRLMDALWSPDDEVSEGALTQLVLVLRRGLGPEGRTLVRTVAKGGYAFSGTPTPARPPTSALPNAASDTPADAPASPASEHADAEGRGSYPKALWLAALALIALVYAALGLQGSLDRPIPPATLGFAGISPGDDSPGLGEAAIAMHEMLAAQLRGSPGVALRRREDMPGLDPLQTPYRLSARITRPGQQASAPVRVHWRLEAPHGPQEWASEHAPDRLFEAVQAVLDELSLRVPTLALAPPPRPVPEAALLHYAHAHRALAASDLGGARQGFELALALTPDFALAGHALAEVLAQQGFRNLAVAHARAALEALDVDSPSYPLLAHRLLSLQNLHVQASQQARRLVLREPGDPEWRLLLAASLVSAGELESARRELDELAPELMAARWQGRWLLQHYRLAVASGRIPDARERAQALADFADLQGLHDLAVESRALLADAAVRMSDYATAAPLLKAAADRFEQLGLGASAVRARALRLQVSDWAGEPQPLEAYLQVRDRARALGNAELEAGAEFALSNFHSVRMDFAAQRTHLLASRRLLEILGPHPWMHMNSVALAHVESRLGRLDEAWGLLDGLRDSPGGEYAEQWRIERERALTRLRQNRLEDAIALARSAHRLAEAAGRPGAELLECEAWALSAQWVGADTGAAAAGLDACLARLETSQDPADLAWRVYLHAAWGALLADSDPARALEEARRSLSLVAGLPAESRIDLLPAWPLLIAAVLPADEATAAVDRLLELPWAESAHRERALLLGLRCVLRGLDPARPVEAIAVCHEAGAVAPSREGLVGDLLALASLAWAQPGPALDADAAGWLVRAEAGGHRALLSLGRTALRVETAHRPRGAR